MSNLPSKDELRSLTGMAESHPPIGHNSLLAVYAEQNAALPDYLKSEHGPLLATVRELEEEYLKRPNIIHSDELERSQTDLGGKIAKCLKAAAAQKKATKEPVQAGVKIVDDFFTRLTAPLEAAMRQVERSVNAYKDEKRAAAERQRAAAERAAREAADEARRKQQEAARLAEEEDRARREQTTLADDDVTKAVAQERIAAEDEAARAAAVARQAQAEAAAKPAPAAKVVGDSGVSSIQRANWTAEIEDLEALDLNDLRAFFSRPAIESAVRAFATHHKDTKPLAGVRVFQKTSTAFR